MDEFEPAEILQIEDLETLKIVADPLRWQIFEQLVMAPLTVKQVAERLGLSAGKLYYHINLLERQGLVRVVETRTIANIIEKLYRAAADSLEVAPSLLNFRTDEGQQNILSMVTATVDAVREDLLRSLEARRFELSQGGTEQRRRTMITRDISRVSEETAQAFFARLQALIEEFGAADVDTAGGDDVQAYALSVIYYPSIAFPEQD